ncbi:MAG: hypothetical protein KJ579_08510, partial [Verrucomicrobia bacterium]|nr:hypothetical protein [Verrucomicrobiota bacterium]
LADQQAAAAGGEDPQVSALAREKLLREIARLEAETSDRAASAELKVAKAKETETKTLITRAAAVAAAGGAPAVEPALAVPTAEPTPPVEAAGAIPQEMVLTDS